jgi:hypothetical protein
MYNRRPRGKKMVLGYAQKEMIVTKRAAEINQGYEGML